MDQTSLAAETEATTRRAGMLSQSVLRSAIELLQLEHGIPTVNAALTVLREASRRNNITVQSLAAALVKSDGIDAREAAEERDIFGTEPPPHLSFSSRGQDFPPDRTLVLCDFMRATMARAGAGYGTVQLRDTVNGGLNLVGHRGFDRRFTEFFSYVEASECPCGHALAQAAQVVVTDVMDAPEFGEAARAIILESGIRAIQSTPLIDERGVVSGMVSTLSRQPHDVPPDPVLRAMRSAAEECTRWLRWYDRTVMPTVLMSVHAAASRAVSLG